MATAPDSQHGDNLKKFDLSPLASYFDSISNDEHRQQFIELRDKVVGNRRSADERKAAKAAKAASKAQ